jgi:hypothetical protein
MLSFINGSKSEDEDRVCDGGDDYSDSETAYESPDEYSDSETIGSHPISTTLPSLNAAREKMYSSGHKNEETEQVHLFLDTIPSVQDAKIII